MKAIRAAAPYFSNSHGFKDQFFFSSRRRHTRCLSDWSSDVCSSDLTARSSPSAGGGSRSVGPACSEPPDQADGDLEELRAELETRFPGRDQVDLETHPVLVEGQADDRAPLDRKSVV